MHTVALSKKAPCLKSGIAIEEKVSDGLQDLAQGDTKTLLDVPENGGYDGAWTHQMANLTESNRDTDGKPLPLVLVGNCTYFSREIWKANRTCWVKLFYQSSTKDRKVGGLNDAI